MGKRRIRPAPGDGKFHAPKAKRILQEAPEAAGSALPVPSRSSDPDGDPAGMDPQESNSSGAKADAERILEGERGAGSPQEGKDKEIAGGRALGSLEQGISKGMEENHPELPQLRILEEDGTEEGDLELPKAEILNGAGENRPESPKPAILEVDGAGGELPESVKPVILDGMGQDHLESSQLRILEGDGAGEEQLESVKVGILDGTGKDQLESPKPEISEVDGAAEEQQETPTHQILDGAGEQHPESVKPEISEADGAREEQREPLKQGTWDGAGENEPESAKQGDSGAHRSSPEDTAMDTAPVESSEVPEGEGEERALEEEHGPGIVLSTDTGSSDGPGDPRSGGGDRNSQGGTPGPDPAATEPQEQQEGTGPELPAEKPRDTSGQIHPGSMGNSAVQPCKSARAAEPADASDVVRGLIRELSDLNRLAMGAHRGLELLRRPKPRRGRRPVPSGSHWKEG